MRSKDESKFKIIADEIKRFLIAKGRIPSQKEISNSVGLGKTAVCRYLKAMREKGMIEGSGREISTRETQLVSIPIVDSLQDSSHTYDNATINDFVFVSRKIYGDGEIGIIRAIDDSMSLSNINLNNFIMIRRQKDAAYGQIVLVFSKGKFYLRRLTYDTGQKATRLTSESQSYYADISEYEIRGVAISVIAHFDEDIIKRYMHQMTL